MLKHNFYIYGMITSTIGIAAGIVLLFLAYKTPAKKKEVKLAIGNILIAIFAPLCATFGVEFFLARDETPKDDIKAQFAQVSDTITGPTLASSAECLKKWYLDEADVWHYSFTSKNGKKIWQAAEPTFSLLGPNRLVGTGTWIDPQDGSRVPYLIEVGCRGKRGELIFTATNQGENNIPTIEVYPELPDNEKQPQVIGYAIDTTWEDAEVLAPSMISRAPLHRPAIVGPIEDDQTNQKLSALWRDRFQHAGKVPTCTLCETLQPK